MESKDVPIPCFDRLAGFPEAIETTWSRAIVKNCVVYLIRTVELFDSYGDRKAVSAQLKTTYTAPNIESTGRALDNFEASALRRKHPSAMATWCNAWERFTPFSEFQPELRYVKKSRSHFQSDAAPEKMLWLAICNVEDR